MSTINRKASSGEEHSIPLERVSIIVKNYGHLVKVCVQVFNQILGKEQVENVIPLEKVREKFSQDRSGYADFFRNQVPGLIDDLATKTRSQIKASRFRFGKTFLEDMWIFVNVISRYLGDIYDICKEIDFRNAQVSRDFQKLQEIDLVSRLSSIEEIEGWLKQSIDSLIEGRGLVCRAIVDSFWDDYSRVFILKQRIDEYELKMEDIPHKSKLLLEEVSIGLQFACKQVRDFFHLMGINPIEVKLFEYYDPERHDEGTLTSILSDGKIMDIVKARIDEKLRAEENASNLIFDILSWGYVSNVDGLNSKNPRVLVYKHDDMTYNTYFNAKPPV